MEKAKQNATISQDNEIQSKQQPKMDSVVKPIRILGDPVNGKS